MDAKTYDNKRLKIGKREKEVMIDFNYQKQIPIQKAFQLEKNKSQALKEKYDKLQIKCQLLYEKLHQQKGSPDQLFNQLNNDVYQLDKNIRHLEQQLYFRYSKQMIKLKRKVKNFLEIINFSIEDQDLQPISDEVDLILLLIEVFQLKYDELTQQNEEILQLVKKVKQPEKNPGTSTKIIKLEEQIKYYMNENQYLKDLVKDYKREIFEYKQDQDQSKDLNTFKKDEKIPENDKTIQKYKIRINKLQSELELKDKDIQNKQLRIQELQHELQNANDKIRKLQKKLIQCEVKLQK